jgi:hypothetical protein
MEGFEKYTGPVRQLLELGEPGNRGRMDYCSLGLKDEHVPLLIEMATDHDLNYAMSDTLEVWAPIHAMRALGQLKASSATERLLGMLGGLEEFGDDYLLEELPHVFSAFGKPALPALMAFAANRDHYVYARTTALDGILHMFKGEPSVKPEATVFLREQLGRHAEEDSFYNAFCVSGLMDLRDTESAPLIQQAMEADSVDISFCGDWEDVQIELGLLDHRITPRKSWYHPPFSTHSSEISNRRATQRKKQSNRNRAKQARKAKKRNRR